MNLKAEGGVVVDVELLTTKAHLEKGRVCFLIISSGESDITES